MLKEIKMRPVTETHDYDFKVKNAKKFIAKGDKVNSQSDLKVENYNTHT